ncbi:MAG: carbohydrate ABC transporter permease [Oscillospiraceae bacterium]|nr:carbohydrate ABC transporter permease [Oscillospiraceae bacterium]
MNTQDRLDRVARIERIKHILSYAAIIILAVLFTFPLYWIITGAFKTKQDIMSVAPVWVPTEWVMTNFENLMSKRSAPLFDMTLGGWAINAFGYTFKTAGITITGPTVPAAIRWLVNTVFMSVSSMLITCLTAAMAGYALAKKRFYGRALIFSLIVCAMALPKQVILIPMLREMGALGLYDTIWAVIFPIVGWPFGVFLLKQFAEGVPTEMVEACRIDGANEWRTFTDVIFPMIKPGVGACAIFTFINSWNDYFMQLIMLTSSKNLTISLGIATMQGENATDFGLLMAGAALASVPIIIVFLVFQKYFTKGITMGAVKG